MTATPREPNTIRAEELQAAVKLYEEGLYLQTYQATRPLGPLDTWAGTKATVFAGRLAVHLGASRLSNWLMRRAWRSDPTDPEAQYYFAYCLWRMRGPYRAWRWMHEHAELRDDASPDMRSSWYALYGGIAAMVRDFDTADEWLSRAAESAPDSPWIEVCRAQSLEFEDRYEEALLAARRSLEIHPWYRPAVQSAAHLLTLMERDDEAMQLLMDASEHLESNGIAGQLYGLQLELERYDDAGESLERFAELSPLADKHTAKWLAAQRSEIAYRQGDVDGAIRYAGETDDEFFKAIAERMQDPARAEAKAVTLPVGFVRQHHLTCAPATLSAISRFWSMPADHLQLADDICYNGTSSHSERKWAEDNDWVAREFSVTESSAVALLDHGIPFTFTTVDPGNSHLQAVIGYDGRRGTLVVRDPFWRNAGEALADKVLKRYQAFGPRGMALVPTKEREKLEAVDLPDFELWDLIFALDGALIAHRRDEAQEIHDRLQAQSADHALTLHARRRLAIYDGNPTEYLAAVEQLLEISPDDQTLQLERLTCLRDLARRDDRLATYRSMCEKKETHPIFWQQYAQELRVDARRHEDAEWLLRRAIRRWPTEGANYYILANIYWDQRRFDESLELYRFAACLADKEEQFARGYFSAATCRKQTERALKFLRNRFDRFGQKSSLPARTLFSAHMQLDRSSEALAVVEQALELRPDDGDLLLFAADVYVVCSSENMAKAEDALERAKGKTPEGEWLRTAARLASSDGRLTDALAHWQEILHQQPLAIDAHRAVTHLLAETQGTPETLAHLEQAADRFPHHHPLHELWIEWLRDEPGDAREAVIRRVVAVHPDDAWVRRELALVLADQRRFDEAREQLDLAEQLEPTNPSYFIVQAHVQRAEERNDEARKSLRRAVELSVDNDYAIAELIDLCETADERREVLGFVKDELVSQVIFGDGLLEFQTHARGTLEPAELLALLREALDARPDLWHAWSAIIGQLLDTDQLDEAWQVACQATERFPLLPRLWLDRANVCRARGDGDAELEALETAYQINPDWGAVVRALCDVHDRRGDFERSRQLLEKAVERSPLDIVNRIILAETLWRIGEREQALDYIHDAVQRDPGYERAWDLLSDWADQLGCPERASEAVRELTVRRAGEARSWLMLARRLDAPDELDERLAVLDKVVELSPRCVDAYDLRAASLASAGRWDEAQEACRPPLWNDRPPVVLRGRSAWLEAEQGNLQEAIARMREVVADEPFFFEAWSRLADWNVQARDCAGYLEAAEMLVRLRPQYEVGYGYLGEARLLNDDRDGAREAYQRAVELNPAYEFAGNGLFDIQFEDNDLSAAAETISALRTHSGSPFVTAREAQLAAKQGTEEEACDALKRVALMASDSPWPISAAVESLVSAGWEGAAEQTLENLLFNEDVHVEAASQWVKLCAARRDWKCADQLPKLCERGEIGLQATYTYVEALLQAGNAVKLKRFFRENESWLREHTFAWGSAGYGLTGLREYRVAAEWQSDWRDREDLEPWMLVNVAEGLRAIGRDAEAVEASQLALSMPPAYGQHLHYLWLAVDEALRGNITAAKEHLEDVDVESLDEDYQFLQTMIGGIVEMAEASPDEAGRVFRDERRRIGRARAAFKAYQQEPARRRAYRRSLAMVAKYRGTFAAKLWFYFRWISSW
ncbi:MAG: tetratricopeptide repeat protein [Planctomycetes bacterium]|nr:tetratricopeptide repeat protein [Planctomycetota bacterium]